MANIIHIGGGGGGSTPTLITKSITENGTYNAIDDNADGYSSVEVDVAGGGGTVVQNLKLNEGKIATQTGEIVADSDYYYTDEFDMPSGYMMFDMNLSSNQTYDGLVIYDDSGNYNNYWNPNARFRVVNMAPHYQAGYKCRLSFRKSNIDYVVLRDYNANILYTTNTPVVIGDEHYHYTEYVDISDFAFYYRKNTSTPTVTSISSTEVSLTYQDQNNTGYELSSYSVSLEKGIYVAEIYATVSRTDIQTQYTWGIYSCNSSGWATVNSNAPMDNEGIDTYVPFDRSDTNEHYYEVPIKMLSDGTAYICFATAGDGGVNATVTVRSLKIRKAFGSESGGLQLHSILTAGVISNDQNYQTANFENSISNDDNCLLMRMLKDGSYRYMYLSKSDIPASGEYAFAFSDVQCAISQTAIRATYYSGSWRYIYVDIIGSSDLIFPQSE